MIKNRWYVFQRLLTIFLLFFLFSQKASNITSILLQDLRKQRPDEVNILVATHELESFAIKYGKTHLTAKKKLTLQQNLFGELVFVIFSWIYKVASSFILTDTFTQGLYLLSTVFIVQWLVCYMSGRNNHLASYRSGKYYRSLKAWLPGNKFNCFVCCRPITSAANWPLMGHTDSYKNICHAVIYRFSQG